MRGFSNDDNSRMPGSRFPAGVKVIVIVLISVSLMVIDSHANRLAPVRDSIAVALQPLQVMAALPAEAWHYMERFFDRDELLERNEALSEKVLLLRGRLQKMAALKAENQRIRALLDSAQEIEQDVLIADILAVSPSPYQHYIMLDKGSLDGVFVGQALIDSKGIMGQIVSVTPMNARAILITDANSAIPVEINRTGLRTIAEGTGQSNQLRLPFLPKTADIRVGDLLVTSGLGGRYPAGYPVARVASIIQPPGSQFLDVRAQPTARLNHGSEVLLVWSHQQQPSPSDAAAPHAKPGDTASRSSRTPHNSSPTP